MSSAWTTAANRQPTALVRWGSRYGWTRRGYGWVAERETSLANTLARFLDNPDLWTTATWTPRPTTFVRVCPPCPAIRVSVASPTR